MRSKNALTKLILNCSMLFIASISSAFAEPLSYSGRLVHTNGSPVIGPVNLKFDLASTADTSVILCSQQIANVVLTHGVFHVKLDLNCGAPTLSQVLGAIVAPDSPAIRVTNESASKVYSFQSLHAVPSAQIAHGLAKLNANSNEVLTWTGSKWEPKPVTGATGGTVTDITAGSGLSGGTITSSGTIAIESGGVTDSHLAGNIARSKVANGTANYVLVNNGTGIMSEVAQLPLTQGGTGADTAAGARTNLGLGTAAVAALGYAAGNALPADNIPVCLPSFKLQFTGIGPTYWSCENDNDSSDATKLPLAGGTMSGAINMGNSKITNLATPTDGTDAATMAYVDAQVSGSAYWTTSGSNIYNSNVGNVGIGNTGPSEKLDVAGNIAASGNLKLKSDNSNYVELKSPAALASGLVFTLPGTAGSSGQALITNGAGNLSWATVATGASAVGGDLTGTVSNSQIAAGAIVNADISASAAIDQSKINGLTGALSGKEPTINAGTTAQYWRGDKSWQTLNGVAVANTPAGGIAATTTQAAINELDSEKQPLITAGTTAQYWRGDKSWQALNGVAVTNTPAGGIAATTTQAAINELDTEKQSVITTATAINAGSVTTNLQNGLNVRPFGTAAGNTGELRFYELAANGTNYTSIKAPDALAANINYVMPSVAPTAGQVLSSSAAGVMSWTSFPSAPVTTVFGRSGAVVATAGDYTATLVTNTPSGSIAGTTVQAAINELGTEKQPVDATLTALAAFATNGLLTRTGADTFAGRSIVGVANRTTVTNGDGVAGNPTININTTLLPSPVAGDTGYFLKATAANASDWLALTSGEVTTALGFTPVNKAGDTLSSGTFTYSGTSLLRNANAPSGLTDVTNKSYVDTAISNATYWQLSGSDVYRASGKVGIGVTAPLSTLDVRGTAYFRHNYNGTYPNYGASMGAGGLAIGWNGGAGTIGETNFVNFPGVGSGGFSFLLANSSGAVTSAPFVINGMGRVGIGSTAPNAKLEVVRNFFGESYTSAAYIGAIDGGIANTGLYVLQKDNVGISNAGTKIINVAMNGASYLNVIGTGNVGIGLEAPTYKLHVNGSVAGVGAYNALSDRRYKKDFQKIPDALERVVQLNGLYYKWKQKENPKMEFEKGRDIGVIAQEVEKVFPEAVSTDKSSGIKSVAYSKLIAPIIEAIKELLTESQSNKREIASIKADNKTKTIEIERLKRENGEMKARLERIERSLNSK